MNVKEPRVDSVIVGILGILFICLAAGPSFAHLTAVVTAANDFTTSRHPVGTRVSVPRVVARKIETLVGQAYSPENKSYFPRRSFFGPIFRITAPKNCYLYVFRRTGPMDSDFYFFILFDPATNRITRNPVFIYGKWMEGDDWGSELRRPLLSFEDIYGDGELELIVEERVHNGTMYNAVVYHYYYASPDLALCPILAVETRLFDVFTWKMRGVITRAVRKLAKGEIRLEVTLDYQDPTPVHAELGSVILHSSQPGNPFEIVERAVIDSKYARLLITGSETDEAKFIVEGYDFYY